MPSCLGIYFSEKSIKYAKIVMDNSGNVRLDHYGTRVSNGVNKDVVENIIAETSSAEIPVVTNSIEEYFEEVSIFDQIQETSYSPDAMKMEFETWCENNQKQVDKNEYVYKLSKIKTSENRHNGVLCITPKERLKECSGFENAKVASVYPARLLYTELAPEEVQNYIIVNLDDDLSVETVIGRRMFDFKIFPVGMRKIFESLTLKLGSYQRAYSACKQLNVYTDGENTNDPELERVVEPILQEILKNVSSIVTANKDIITRIYITGSGIILNNIDVLFTEYLEMKSEILKPLFLNDTSDIRSLSEILETVPPMAMAYKFLQKKSKFLNYLHPVEDEKKPGLIDQLKERMKKNVSFKKKEKQPKEPKVSTPNEKTPKEKMNMKEYVNSGLRTNQVAQSVDQREMMERAEYEVYKNRGASVAAGFAVFAIVSFFAYGVFSFIYSAANEKIVDDINTRIKLLTDETSKINSDISYIESNTTMYSDINKDVAKLVSQIESGEIGKISTYNVAAFLQKIIKIIPKGVTLDTVKSDDNKHVVISMYSAKYADLGYFVAQLKLQGVLNSVEVKNIDNTAEKITIEIGGELP